MIKSLLYILPIHPDHEGIQLKVNGQLNAFENIVQTRCLFLSFSRQMWVPFKLIGTLFFNIKAITLIPFYHYIYCRYNPKALILNIFIPFLSYLRPIFIEHNTIMDTELRFLDRHFEHRLHLLTLRWFRWGKMTHIAVNNELKNHLIKFGLPASKTIYLQNGYSIPDISQTDIDTSVINQVKTFQSKHHKCAIFCGNGYAWHGLDEVLKLIKTEPQLGLIIVGPYAPMVSNQTLFISSVNTATLLSIFDYCHFGISTFRWDLLYITEGSPLKSRQFLCHGLPILTHYYDCASDIDLLKPYIFDVRTNKKALQSLLRFSCSKEKLSTLAQDALSWEHYVKALIK